METGSFLDPIERAFTDPTVERLTFLLVVVASILLLNQATGFTHHYDLSRQIREFKELQAVTDKDSATAVRMDSLRTSIISQMEEWQAPPTPDEERTARILTTLPLGLLILGVALLADIEKPLAGRERIKRTSNIAVYALMIPFLSVILVDPQGSLVEAVGMTVVSQVGVVAFMAVGLLFIFPAMRAGVRYTMESILGYEISRDPQIDGIADGKNQE